MNTPVRSDEARESRLISLAVDLAERQLEEGTASSQVIVHYLKLGTTREKIEKEILERQKDLIEAKTDSLKANQQLSELFTKAIEAMKNYGPSEDDREII